MELEWDDLISRLPMMLQKLEGAKPLRVGGDLSSLQSCGVYVLYEHGKAIYTGKAGQMEECVKGHYSPEFHSFPWILVREEARRQDININGEKWKEFEIKTAIRYGHKHCLDSKEYLRLRDEYEQDKQFKEWYKLVKAAQKRVKQMEVRALGTQNRFETDIFFSYTWLKLKTHFSDYTRL